MREAGSKAVADKATCGRATAASKAYVLNGVMNTLEEVCATVTNTTNSCGCRDAGGADGPACG